MVVVYPADTVVFAGNSLLLTCVGYGIPLPSLYWQTNGKTISEEDSGFFLSETVTTVENSQFVRSSLFLCNAREAQAGNYSCSANNTVHGISTKNFSITVQSKPLCYQ